MPPAAAKLYIYLLSILISPQAFQAGSRHVDLREGIEGFQHVCDAFPATFDSWPREGVATRLERFDISGRVLARACQRRRTADILHHEKKKMPIYDTSKLRALSRGQILLPSPPSHQHAASSSISTDWPSSVDGTDSADDTAPPVAVFLYEPPCRRTAAFAG